MLEHQGKDHLIPCTAPLADMFNTNPASRPIRRGKGREYNFLLHCKGGATGKARLRVQVVDDAAGNNPVDIKFRYRNATAANDVYGALTDAAAAATIETVENTEQVWRITVLDSEIHETPNATDAKEFIRMKFDETVDAPVVGSLMCEVTNLHIAKETHATFLT